MTLGTETETGIYAHTPSLIRFGSQRFSLKSRQRTINFDHFLWSFFRCVVGDFFSLCACWADFARLFIGFIMGRSLNVFILRSQATEHNFNALYRAAPLRMRHWVRSDTLCEYWFMLRDEYFICANSKWKFRTCLPLTISAHLIFHSSLSGSVCSDLDIRWIHIRTTRQLNQS